MASEERYSWFRIENHLNNGARPEKWPWAQWDNLENWDDKWFLLRTARMSPAFLVNTGHYLKFSNKKEWNDSIDMEISVGGAGEKIFGTTLHVQHHPDHSDLSRHWLMGEGRLRNGPEYYVYVFRLGNDDSRPENCKRRIYVEAYRKDGRYLEHRPFNSRIIPSRGLNAIDPPTDPDPCDEGREGLSLLEMHLQDDSGTGYERPPDR